MVAILRLDDLSNAVELSRVLLDAGVSVQEFTLSNPEAIDAIRRVREEIEEFSTDAATLGIGSVRTTTQAEEAIGAGAQFVVTPVLVENVISHCCQYDIPVFPGALTPTEIAKAWDLGATAVKIFPARAFGPSYIKDLLAPMPDLKLLPTGGVTLENIPAYMEAGAMAVGVGGNLFSSSDVEAKRWENVRASASAFTRCIHKWMQQ